jgi:hypothetical protein
MSVLASILVFALTRAELIERFRTPPVTQVEGLVQVYADCPSDMRREYQLPVASYVADICKKLYSAGYAGRRRFMDPGIVVHLGSVRTNDTAVVVATDVRPNGDRFMRITLPAPGFADMNALCLAVVRGFSLSVMGEEIDDERASRLLRMADPAARRAEERGELARWRERGEFAEGRDDEYYLKSLRKVSDPGTASTQDVLVFASRLMLYPPYYALPFGGRFAGCTFSEAIELSKVDPVVRFAAARKINEILLFGGGRGERMTAAAEAYAEFLKELARGEMSSEELWKMLSEADEKLKGVVVP